MLGAASPSWQQGGVCADPSRLPDGVGAGRSHVSIKWGPEAQGTGYGNEQVGSAPIRKGDTNTNPA